MRKRQQATRDRIAQLQLQILWDQMQMKTQTSTHLASTTQALYT